MIYKLLNKPLPLLALYKPNPIFIPHHVCLHKHTLRTYDLHWNHNTCYCSFGLILCDTHLIFHCNKIPNGRVQWICKVICEGDHFRPRYKIWLESLKIATTFVTPYQRGFIQTGWIKQYILFNNRKVLWKPW